MDIYAVGDVHGESEKLKSLIDELPLKENDQLVFLGDYVDRGPDSKGVIEYLIELKIKMNCIFIRGNHEDMMIRSLRDDIDNHLWMLNGGSITLDNYGGVDLVPDTHKEFLNSTLCFYETDNYFFCHAGIDPKKNINENTDQDLMWIRDEFLHAPSLPTDKLVIHGHTPKYLLVSIYDGIDRLCLDNGACFGRPLMACRLADRTLFYSTV